MLHNKLKSFAEELVIGYSKYIHGNTIISLQDIPDFDQDRFCALIISDTREYGNEICGADNDKFNSEMLPSLLLHLNNSNHEEKKEDFLSTWRAGIRSYLQHNMQRLLDEALENLDLNREEAA